MGNGRWGRVLVGVLVPVAVAGMAGCGSSGAQSTTGNGDNSLATKSLTGAFTGADLRSALLTKVNGVGAAAPASIGKYSSLPTVTSTGKKAPGVIEVTPKSCAGASRSGFSPTSLSDSQAAVVTFKVGGNDVSEVLIASDTTSATNALAARAPIACARYTEKVGGKTFTYTSKETPVTGIGKQAKELSVHSDGAAGANLWSLIYRGTGFVGTVTVAGPSASEKAVRELGQQAYAYAAKSLS